MCQIGLLGTTDVTNPYHISYPEQYEEVGSSLVPLSHGQTYGVHSWDLNYSHQISTLACQFASLQYRVGTTGPFTDVPTQENRQSSDITSQSNYNAEETTNGSGNGSGLPTRVHIVYLYVP